MAGSTGQGSTLIAQNSSLKFGSTESYTIQRIGPVLGRSVSIIERPDLSIASGKAKKYCPGDLQDLSPITVVVEQDFENITRFPNSDSDVDVAPFPLGEQTGASSTDTFLLTLKGGAATANFAKLDFSGFISEDSGFELISGRTDPLVSTITIQPDGERIVWNGVGA